MASEKLEVDAGIGEDKDVVVALCPCQDAGFTMDSSEVIPVGVIRTSAEATSWTSCNEPKTDMFSSLVIKLKRKEAEFDAGTASGNSVSPPRRPPAGEAERAHQPMTGCTTASSPYPAPATAPDRERFRSPAV